MPRAIPMGAERDEFFVQINLLVYGDLSVATKCLVGRIIAALKVSCWCLKAFSAGAGRSTRLR